MSINQAFWIAAAAVLEREGTLPDQLLQRSLQCVQESNDPQIVCKILAAAFPEMRNLPLNDLCNVAATLLDKSLNSSPQDGSILGQPTDMLEPLRASFLARPGLLLFAAETINLWLSYRSLQLDDDDENAKKVTVEIASQQHQQQCAYMRAVEILLWLAEVSTRDQNMKSPAFTSFANLLALAHQPLEPLPDAKESILTTVFRHFQTFSNLTKLQAIKLVGLCCQHAHSSAFYTGCWAALEHILCTEKNEEVLGITACALFESIASHAPTFTSSLDTPFNNQLRAVTALENGLACPMPCIQFWAALAAGKLLRNFEQPQFWQEGVLERVATAADQAYTILQDRIGAWSAWQPDTAAAVGVEIAAEEEKEKDADRSSVLHLPSSLRKLTAQHVLAVLESVHRENFPKIVHREI